MFECLAYPRILWLEYIEFLGPLHGRYALAVNRFYLKQVGRNMRYI